MLDAVAPQAAYLNLYLAMAGEDVTMGKSAEAHHSLGRNTKHKGDMLRETRSGVSCCSADKHFCLSVCSSQPALAVDTGSALMCLWGTAFQLVHGSGA